MQITYISKKVISYRSFITSLKILLQLFYFAFYYLIYFSTQLLGIAEATARINAMVERGKQNIGISELIPLDCLVNIK